ncbi:hypothetical protein [Yoonia sp.]|uniref:hypothetical protein n=1 Tax=Yoonia sp. TaxID=2212373 RepID=UPI002FDAC350
MTETTHVLDFDGIAKVLRDPDFDVVRFGDGHHYIGQYTGIDVSEIVSAFRAVPLSLRGEDHAAARQRLARIVAEAAPQTGAFIEAELPALIDALLQPGRHDVLAEFIIPLSEGFMKANIGAAPAIAPDSMIPRALSATIGIAKRKRLNTEMGALRQHLARALPHLGADEIADRMVLAILGTDALRGTLGQSLHAYFEGAPNSADPTAPPRTGVPRIPREVIRDHVIDGKLCPAGHQVKAELKSFNDSDKTHERIRFFGFGAHTCIGRQMSLKLWRRLVEVLDAHAPDVRILAYSLRRDDVFDIPEEFQIEVR